MRGLLLPVALVLFPLLLGLPWMELMSGRRLLRVLLCWPLGYFLALALFEVMAVPFTWLKGSFFDLAPCYTVLVAAVGGISLMTVLNKRKRAKNLSDGCAETDRMIISNTTERTAQHVHVPLSFWEWLYLIAFLVLVIFQLVRAVTWDMTIMNYDDYDYVARAADAVTHGSLLGVNPGTGLAENLNIKRIMQSYLLFPAWLSWISGISVTTMTRTVLETVHLGMAYTVYAGMAVVLFPKRENGLIFLFLLSLLFLMGHYSHYSPTFRLLGPNYQGKAVLAVVFSPLIFTLIMAKLPDVYDWRFGGVLLLLSMAAVSMTLFGVAVIIADAGLPVMIFMVHKPRDWKKTGYILWASVFPAACAVAYVWLR